MHRKIEVKVCGLTRPEDVRAAIRLGAGYFGINGFPRSPRYVAEEATADVLAEIPEDRAVAVVVAPADGRLANLRETGFGHFQVHFDLDTPLATLARWSEEAGSGRLWLAPRLPPDDPFPEDILEFADTVLVDGYATDLYGGTGKTGNWQEFNALHDIYPETRWVLAGGLSPANIGFALEESGARFVDVNSGIEDSPGKKNHIAMEAFFNGLKG
jgi:phosphoribosylanthranilate isomerase